MRLRTKEDCEQCQGGLRKFINRVRYVFNADKLMIGKSEAYDSATYGKCMDREQFILQKQVDINSRIRAKVNTMEAIDSTFDRYFLLLPFTEVEEMCADEILKPFVDSGFEIINLSDEVDAIKGMNVRLLGWKNFTK